MSGIVSDMGLVVVGAAGRMGQTLVRTISGTAGARIAGAKSVRLPNTSCIILPGVSSETQVMALDLAGVAVSAGSACSSGKVRPSHVLGAMGLPPEEAGAAIRVSLGWASQPSDVERFVEAWSVMAARRTAA